MKRTKALRRVSHPPQWCIQNFAFLGGSGCGAGFMKGMAAIGCDTPLAGALTTVMRSSCREPPRLDRVVPDDTRRRAAGRARTRLLLPRLAPVLRRAPASAANDIYFRAFSCLSKHIGHFIHPLKPVIETCPTS